MKPVICPSCGHEVYDKTGKCPFCGTDLPNKSIFSSSTGATPSSRAKVLVLIGLMVTMAIGGFSFFMVMRSTDKAKLQVEVSHRMDNEDTVAEDCRANMQSILFAEEDYMAEYGHYTDNIEDLLEFDNSLYPVCPQSNTPYNIVITKQDVQVSCSIHGVI